MISVKIDQFAASSIDIKLICFTNTKKYLEWMKIKDILAIEIKNIVEKIYKLYDLNPKNYLDIKEERVGKDLFYKLDSSKLRKNIKWSQKISLEDGLIRYKDWFQKIKLKKLKTDYIHKK